MLVCCACLIHGCVTVYMTKVWLLTVLVNPLGWTETEKLMVNSKVVACACTWMRSGAVGRVSLWGRMFAHLTLNCCQCHFDPSTFPMNLTSCSSWCATSRPPPVLHVPPRRLQTLSILFRLSPLTPPVLCLAILSIVLNLCSCLPSFKQYVTCPTCQKKTLDLCYGNIPNAYKYVILPPNGTSDHDTVHLVPAYRPKIQTDPVVKSVWKSGRLRVWRNCEVALNVQNGMFCLTHVTVNEATYVISGSYPFVRTWFFLRKQ